MSASAALNTQANFENSEWPKEWKMSVFIPIPKKGNFKECSNYLTIALMARRGTRYLPQGAVR